ncbi:uncharacterized protein VICG_01765 [Vittaforma corneae ATCC 50505]|uniref:Uncharacterized protein n=1 Tax=Vittaforma corneae (strain ATCC 50505) TaxID=993615 RepID=L2GJZ6_VITCO|nr:uncharacterized protein VICG_01765 [Vittaforma corneae ATCC 50505]ELA41166.1 hypothetical protein VICG_01765 [Vittaforma corneae ATCC 50505]
MMIAIGRVGFMLLGFGFIAQISAAEFISSGIIMRDTNCETVNFDQGMSSVEASLVNTDQAMMSKLVAGVISCLCLTGESGDASFALNDRNFRRSLKNALKYFIRNRDDLLDAFSRFDAMAADVMRITDQDSKTPQEIETLGILMGNPTFRGFMSRVGSALKDYSRASNLYRRRNGLSKIEDRKQEFSTLLKLFLQKDLAADPQNEKRARLSYEVSLVDEILGSFEDDLSPNQRQIELVNQAYQKISDNARNISALYRLVMTIPSNCSSSTIDEIFNSFIEELTRICDRFSADD